jgi:hypothetical protein
MKPLAATTRSLTAALSILLLTSTAASQPVPDPGSAPKPPAAPERDPAKAETLFKSAKALLDRGDWGAACPKLQASMALDPAVSTLLKIARCHDHEGKLTSAWSDVSQALKLNKALPQPDRRRKELDEYAAKLLADLDRRLPRLRIRAAGAPAALHLTCDGRSLPVAVLGEQLPVDAGLHEIVAEAPGFVAFRTAVTLAEGQSLDVDVVLTAVPPLVPPPPPPSPEDPRSAAVLQPLAVGPVPEPAVPGRPGASRRAAGIGVGAFGVASLGGALALGILTLEWVGVAEVDCPMARCPQGNQGNQGIRLFGQASSMQTGAFVLLGAGAAATATGIALFATAPRPTDGAPSKPEVTAMLGPLGATLHGTW